MAGVGTHGRPCGAGRDLAAVAHGGHHVAHLRQLRAPHVARRHVGAAAQRAVGVASEAAAEVQYPVAGREPQAVVVDGLHDQRRARSASRIR